MAIAPAILTEANSAAVLVVAWFVVEATKGTPMKNKLRPLVGLPASDQEVDAKSKRLKVHCFVPSSWWLQADAVLQGSPKVKGVRSSYRRFFFNLQK